MEFKPDRGYEKLWEISLDVSEPDNSPKRQHVLKLFQELEHFDKPEDMDVIDDVIPSQADEPELKIRIYRKKSFGLTPLVFDIHGGGFVIGSLDKDNNRCAVLCAGVPCTVIQVGYRLAPEYHFPVQLLDCYRALCYIAAHAEYFRIDPNRIALFGSSAGANLAAALSLYIRDNGGPKISLQVLNYPHLGYGDLKPSAQLMIDGAPIVNAKTINDTITVYLGATGGSIPSYYAAPELCRDLTRLPPTAIIASEYCPLRDDGIQYATRLLSNGIPTELYVLPRVPHAYDLIPQPRTKWIQEGICMSLRREFGML